MEFIFEAAAGEYDLAAEQEILLRCVSNRRRNWCIAGGLCALLLVLAAVLIGTGGSDAMRTAQVTLLLAGVVLFEQGYLDATSGNVKACLKNLYRGRSVQSEEELEKKLRVEIKADESVIRVYRGTEAAGEWDFQNLRRVTESDTVFQLVRGGVRKQYLALPKDALREGSAEEFRRCMAQRLGGKGNVEAFTVPEWRKKQLMAAKYKLFAR